MALPDTDEEIRHKKGLLEQHRRNLMFLEKQAIQHGIDLPLAVHNALTTERETIATLERELSQLGVSPVSVATWQAVVIDPDDHWREIVVKQIAHLGGEAIMECCFMSLNQ